MTPHARRPLLALLTLAALAPAALAQNFGGGGGAGGGNFGGGGGGGGAGGGGGGNAQTGNFTQIGGSNTGANVQPSTAIDASNFLRATYANPLYQGRPGQTQTNNFASSQLGTRPGGFGQPSLTGGTGTGGAAGGGLGGAGGGGLGGATRAGGAGSLGATGGTGGAGGAGLFGGTGGTGGGLGGAGARTGLGGAGGAGGLGATGGAGGLGGGLGGTANARGGVGGATGSTGVVPGGRSEPARVAYTATLKFKTRPIEVSTLQSNLRGTLDRSTRLTNPTGIDLSIRPDGVVVLRGSVKDADEATLAANMLRLTPGVKGVVSELTAKE